MAPPTVTLALLPLENIAGTPDVGRLAKGLGYDLLAELARFPTLGVIAADSVQAALEEGREAVANRVGARYLLGGSLRRFGDGLQLNLRLTEADTGRHLWAGRYDGAELPAGVAWTHRIRGLRARDRVSDRGKSGDRPLAAPGCPSRRGRSRRCA
jgi:TolB-like protein